MLNKSILRLAIPNILSNISIPLLATVDLGLMGHMGAQKYLGAVAIGGMIFSSIFWAFGFLRMGTSGFTAQAYGKRNFAETVHILLRAVAVAFGLGLLLILLHRPIAWLAFKIIDGSSDSEQLAYSYFMIRIYSAPAVLLIYVFIGWFIGMQNSRFPMFLSLFINVLNILLSISFIKVFEMGSDGVALASSISQYAGVLLALMMITPYKRFLLKFLDMKKAFAFDAFISFFHVNKDIFIRTLCLIFTLSFFTAQSAKTNDTILAVNTLLFQFFYFFSYFIDGFAFAAEALTGKYVGARNAKMLHKVIKQLFGWGTGIAAFFTLVYALFGNMLLSLLTNDNQIIEAAAPYLFWIILVPFTTFAAFIWDGIYVGATASKAMRNSMVIITIFIFLPLYYILKPLLGNNGLWLALLIFMSARGIFLFFWSTKYVYNPIK